VFGKAVIFRAVVIVLDLFAVGEYHSISIVEEEAAEVAMCLQVPDHKNLLIAFSR
jgi:hypothetical protein